MRTEELPAQPKDRQAFELSRALQDLFPVSSAILDSAGRDAPLGTAGYVLRAGQKYQLLLWLPFPASELVGIQVNCKPDFLDVNRAIQQLDQHGQHVWCVPFRVQSEFTAAIKRFGTLVRADELELAFQFTPGSSKLMPTYSCPIVVMPKTAMVLTSFLSGVVALVLPALFGELFSTLKQGEDGFVARLQHYPTLPWFWAGLGIGVMVFVGLVVFNRIQLYNRSKELRQRFREKYPTPSHGKEVAGE